MSISVLKREGERGEREKPSEEGEESGVQRRSLGQHKRERGKDRELAFHDSIRFRVKKNS